jgi:hypothetical protein
MDYRLNRAFFGAGSSPLGRVRWHLKKEERSMWLWRRCKDLEIRRWSPGFPIPTPDDSDSGHSVPDAEYRSFSFFSTIGKEDSPYPCSLILTVKLLCIHYHPQWHKHLFPTNTVLPLVLVLLSYPLRKFFAFTMETAMINTSACSVAPG